MRHVSLGLILTLVNAIGWASLHYLAEHKLVSDSVVIVPALALSVPGTLCMFPGLDEGYREQRTRMIAVGLNAPIWGYGLAWLISRARAAASPANQPLQWTGPGGGSMTTACVI